MTRRLPKVFGVMLLLLFVGGAVFLPAFHRAHCTDNHAAHDATTCSICQFASTPTITISSAVAPVAESIVFANVVLQVPAIPAPSLRGPTQERAPPVA
jgi:hypothetical protein